MIKDFILQLLLPILFILTISMVPVHFGSKLICEKQFADFEHRYGFIEGCMVKHKGVFVPSDLFRMIDGVLDEQD